MDDWVKRFHDATTELADQIAQKNEGRLVCRAGCSGCCVDGLTVFSIEADEIRAHHESLLADAAPHAEGACAFLDGEGRCRIYAQRPYVCRTQGLPLRWIDEDDNGTPYEARDICELNDDPAAPLEELPSDWFWTLGPFEERLRGRQDEKDPRKRIALRDLFARKDSGSKRRLPIARRR